MMRKIIFLISSLLMLTSFSYAQLADVVSIHGFGGYAVGWTDNENNFVFANEDFNLNEYNFNLNLTARPAEKMLLNTQIAFGKEERWRNARNGYYKRTSPVANIDYLFLHYSYSPLLNIRVGNVMSPIGLYSEIYDVGTLRPFYLLPVGLYRGPGMFPKSYLGAGLSGSVGINSEWQLNYDLIGGEMYFNKFYIETPDPFPNFHKKLFQPVGKYMSAVQLSLENEDLGIKAGGSLINFKAYTSTDEGPVEIGSDNEFLHLYHGFLEYSLNELMVRAEYYTINKYQEVSSYYAEASYMFLEMFQAAISYDMLENATPSVQQASRIVPTSLTHQAIGFGLNYWFNSNIVVKANYYMVSDNAHAAPDWYIETVNPYTFRTNIKGKTNAFILGTQFSF